MSDPKHSNTLELFLKISVTQSFLLEQPRTQVHSEETEEAKSSVSSTWGHPVTFQRELLALES